jgi:hypothetical protein
MKDKIIMGLWWEDSEKLCKLTRRECPRMSELEGNSIRPILTTRNRLDSRLRIRNSQLPFCYDDGFLAVFRIFEFSLFSTLASLFSLEETQLVEWALLKNQVHPETFPEATRHSVIQPAISEIGYHNNRFLLWPSQVLAPIGYVFLMGNHL